MNHFKSIILNLTLFGSLLVTSSCSGQNTDSINLKTGDIVFQDFSSGLSTPIKLITHSDYSHVGVVILIDEVPMVYEAVQPVRLANLNEWISRDKDKKYVVKRHKNSDSLFTISNIKKIDSFYQKHLDKNYDIKFSWSDDDMYCSELVWKMYDEVFGIKIGTKQQLKDLDATHPAVKKKLKELFGNQIPWEETVVSPQALFEHQDLQTIYKN